MQHNNVGLRGIHRVKEYVMTKKQYLRVSIQIISLILFTLIMVSGKMVLWLALYAISVAISFIFGRYFCSYVCPMNTGMKVAHTIKKKKKQPIIKMKWANFIPFISLVVSLLIMLISKRGFNINIPLLLIFVPLSFLYALFFSSSTWHNYICPYSIALKVGGSRSLYRYKVDEEICIGCKQCLKACNVGAITFNSETKKAIINPTLCHVCGDCVPSCKLGAISYSK